MSVRAPPPPPPWAQQLTAVGVTGTNGKTSTTSAIAALLAELARPVARVTTLGCFLDEARLNVAPHYAGFLETMQRCRDAGGRYASIELTSEALALGFARAWPWRIGVFTNLSHDHSDAHGSMEHYLASKAQLFMALPAGAVAVLNARDANAELIAEVTPAGVEIIRYAVPSRGELWAEADLAAHSIRLDTSGTHFELQSTPRFPGLPRAWSIRAIGDVFVENALAALAAALAASVPVDRAAAVLSSSAPPEGRFELVRRQPYVVVDYAHTPDALSRTLATARQLCEGTLTVVFGAGGNRDRAKRPLIGAAARAADRIVLTSDNPRDEDPRAIVDQIAEGIGAHANLSRDLDRKRAIQLALRDAGAKDWVLIAGKGHEHHQETAGVTTAFSDAAIVRELDEDRG
ncbi:MAG TPA: UDP-N-acetylmuramyl-tripeptide synthetase [Polyangiaceae bacterium]